MRKTMANKNSSTKQRNYIFSRVLLLSLLVHASTITYMLMHSSPDQEVLERKVVVQLKAPDAKQQTPPAAAQATSITEPEPVTEQAEQEHMPTHNAEEFASDNQDRNKQGEIVAGGGIESEETKLAEVKDPTRKQAEENDGESETKEQALAQNDQETHQEPQGTSASETVVTEGDSFALFDNYEEEFVEGAELSALAAAMGLGGGNPFQIQEEPTPDELEIPEEYLDGYGNLRILSEGELADAMVEQPFSEIEGKELQLVNRYLERMNKQVLKFWINPYQGNKMLRGIIKLELNTAGFLVNAFIFRSSGHNLLDISVLDAIRSVQRFEVPDNTIIAERYYTNLSFHYSSKQEETELMPFELAAKDTTKKSKADTVN